MNKFFIALNAFLKFFGLIFVSLIIGFWWNPEFDKERNAAFFSATFSLIIFSIYFYKTVIRQKNYMPNFLFTFYSALAIFAVCGYVFGFFVN